MEEYLREWRQDAASRNQLETAIFIGDKALALTSTSHLCFPTLHEVDNSQIATKMHYDCRNSTRMLVITPGRLGFL